MKSFRFRRLGAKLVCDYKDEDLGVKAYDPRGSIQVSGTWSDRIINGVRKKHGESAGKLAKAEATLWKAQPLAHQGQSVMMKLSTAYEDIANPESAPCAAIHSRA
jgi:hypothetical protein